MNPKGLSGHLHNDLSLQVQATVIATVQPVIEAALEAELAAYLGLERYEHLGWGRPPEATRSGNYPRELITQYGRNNERCFGVGCKNSRKRSYTTRL